MSPAAPRDVEDALAAFAAEFDAMGNEDFAREWVHAVIDAVATDERWTPGLLRDLSARLVVVREAYKRRMGPERLSNAGDVIAARVADVKEKLARPGVVMVVLADLGMDSPTMAGVIAELKASGLAVGNKRGAEIGRLSGRKYSVVMREGMGG